MKILVFSDSHRDVSKMEQAIRQHPDAALIVHLGDLVHDAELVSSLFPGLPMRIVPGNNDFRPGMPGELVFEFAGKHLFLCHGHQYRVKYTTDYLIQAASAQHADIALFGHTHVPFCAFQGGIYLLNPGSCSGEAASYGILELDGGEIRMHNSFMR